MKTILLCKQKYKMFIPYLMQITLILYVISEHYHFP